MDAESLINAIKTFQGSHQPKSKNVFLLDEITPDLLDLHRKRYAAIGNDERPLLVVNKKIMGAIGGFGWTGMIITDKYLRYRCLKNSFWSSLIPLTNKARIPLFQIGSLAIGNHDTCYGTAYTGHQLLVNGKGVGLLRMGGGITFDDKAIEELNYIFQKV